MPFRGVYGEMSESKGRLGGMEDTFVKAAEDFRARDAVSIVGSTESFSSLEAPPSASYGEGEVLILGS